VSNISYQIQGTDLQYVEVTIPPGISVLGEQGAMMYMDEKLDVQSVLGDGSQSTFGAMGRLFKAIKRSFTGESLFSSRYTNVSDKPQKVAFATASISKIVAVNLAENGGEVICQKGAYLAGEEGIETTLAFQKKLRVGFFGGEGFIMQRITGKGVVFLNASGALAEIDLLPGQNMRVDSGCLMAITSAVSYEIKYAGKLKTSFFGGEGLFYANVKGPGKVWVQSLPEARLGATLINAAVTGRSRGWGSKLYFIVIIIFAIYAIAGGSNS
jgi:uncharacterized protein (TIGR00266 family)